MTETVLNAELKRRDEQKLREEADYATDSSFSPEDVAVALEDAGKFRELAYQFLRQKGSESVTNYHRLKMEAPGEETKTDKVKTGQ